MDGMLKRVLNAGLFALAAGTFGACARETESPAVAPAAPHCPLGTPSNVGRCTVLIDERTFSLTPEEDALAHQYVDEDLLTTSDERCGYWSAPSRTPPSDMRALFALVSAQRGHFCKQGNQSSLAPTSYLPNTPETNAPTPQPRVDSADCRIYWQLNVLVGSFDNRAADIQNDEDRSRLVRDCAELQRSTDPVHTVMWWAHTFLNVQQPSAACVNPYVDQIRAACARAIPLAYATQNVIDRQKAQEEARARREREAEEAARRRKHQSQCYSACYPPCIGVGGSAAYCEDRCEQGCP